ncbi:hypothetical protein [Paraburkholderia fungorum]|uniref:hypothetical protein n=1 Tax=Paraburkholderia fungorum TaxID=134537 RepID=UPI000AB450D9|nr:hypothetical protein [Paraburkholderia fungorum]
MRNASFQRVRALPASPGKSHRSIFAPLDERRFSLALASVVRHDAPAAARDAS